MDQDGIQSFVGHEAIKGFFEALRGQEVYYVGHNIISFDAPILNRICSASINLAHCVDTLCLSYLYDPVMLGGHSLEAWGDRFKFPKGQFKDFSGYSEAMDLYCQQDVRLGKKVFKGLVSRMTKMGFSELSCEIEHEIRDVINEQQDNGWYFDIPGAQALVSHLRSEQAALEGPIHELFPRRLVEKARYVRRTKLSGGEFASYERHLRQYPEVRDNDDGTYSVLDWEDFNINSPKQRIDRLLSVGYVPASFTPTGSPKVDEDSLIAFAEECGRQEVKAIADWLVLQGRSTMVEGWLNNVNYEDSCMHGTLITCGAPTRRMIHIKPNTANIPKANKKVKYGVECRQLWRARPNRLEVGYDASGLEMRMFAEYLKNDAATLLFTTGDPHIVNTRNLELPDEMRNLTVKNGFYAYLYGAGDEKLGKTIKPQLQADEARDYGKWARGVLERGTPGLARLVADIKDEYKFTGGVLKTIDGGYVRCRSSSAALNYKLQSGGAILMKKAAIIHRGLMLEKGLDAMMVGNIHDELQLDVHPRDAEEVGKTGVEAIRLAGEALNCVVPFTGEWKSGLNWAECH